MSRSFFVFLGYLPMPPPKFAPVLMFRFMMPVSPCVTPDESPAPSIEPNPIDCKLASFFLMAFDTVVLCLVSTEFLRFTPSFLSAFLLPTVELIEFDLRGELFYCWVVSAGVGAKEAAISSFKAAYAALSVGIFTTPLALSFAAGGLS